LDNQPLDPALFTSVLKRMRRRRKYLFATVLMYVPAVVITHQIAPANSVMGTLFGVWLVFLVLFTALVAVCRCPRCGNYFHVHGMTLLILRRCLHCQLHIGSDTKQT